MKTKKLNLTQLQNIEGGYWCNYYLQVAHAVAAVTGEWSLVLWVIERGKEIDCW